MTTFDDYRLGDRYANDSGEVFLTGIQALVRLPIEQLRADRANGLNTAAFLSGYQGSPLGGFDQEMARAAKQVPELPIVVQPGVNEELGASAVMGSQLVSTQPDAKYDGVLGIWYGKAPGLDRAGDTLRHAVFAGTSRHGGAIALVGDDPAAKSSTLPSSSDATLVDLHMPILYPGDVQEALDLGRHAVAMSRATGLWAAMKIVAAVADGSGTVDLAPSRIAPIIPDLTIDGQPYEHRPNGQLITPYTLDLEREFRVVRAELLQRYASANDLNRVTINPPDAWIGLMASGYTYHELLEALRRLGLETPDAIHDAGIRLMQMQMPVPFDPSKVREFAKGLDEIVVVEEKNPTLEWLVKDALYGGPDQPRVVGKTHEDGRELMRSYSILDSDSMIEGLRERLSPRLASRLAPPPPVERERILIPLSTSRQPYFCSGCPHNHGTKVPEGSLVGAGIGCHGMVMFMPEEKVGDISGITAMGAEGTQWIGMSPFIERNHFIQNLGDGTFFHSGQLAVQASIAAGVNVTYKLLFNGTVAMTGGQDAAGAVGVPEICAILLAHGVKQVLITTEDLDDYKSVKLPSGIEVWDRGRIVEAQERLAAVEGVTVLINDQACAAENRRLRKRGQMETPKFRTVINHRICEGCGDCGEVSNCLSVQPLDTPLGLKTTIDQTSCNLDFSCLEGDCPSFMTVEVGNENSAFNLLNIEAGDLVAPATVEMAGKTVGIRLAGIGGTGVVTVAQIIGTAAMFDGKHVRGLDQTGLSQKAGPVVSDLRLSIDEPAVSNLLGEGGADVVVAFDLLVGADDKTLDAVGRHTTVIGSTSPTPTGAMIGHPELGYPTIEDLVSRIEARGSATKNVFVDAAAIAEDLFGVTSSVNIFLLGIAVQVAAIPISPEAIERAIELNGIAVDMNVAAFRAGRKWAIDPEAFTSGVHVGQPEVIVEPLSSRLDSKVTEIGLSASLAELVRMLASDLVAYQNEAYAKTYLGFVSQVAASEQPLGGEVFTEAAARGLHKLMAYKDEYEVARLLLGPEGKTAAAEVGGKNAKVHWRLHPPALKAGGMQKKLSLPAKQTAVAMKALVKAKRLRGTALDPFGRAEVRKVERAMIGEYQTALESLAVQVAAGKRTPADAAEVANLALDVRGYEDLKLRRAATFRAALAERV